MNRDLNRVTITGRIGNTPEVKSTENGRSVMRLRVAIGDFYIDANGEKVQTTNWATVKVWGKSAEGLAKFLKTGHEIYVDGSWQCWVAKGDNGDKTEVTEIRADHIGVLREPRSKNRDDVANYEEPAAATP